MRRPVALLSVLAALATACRHAQHESSTEQVTNSCIRLDLPGLDESPPIPAMLWLNSRPLWPQSRDSAQFRQLGLGAARATAAYSPNFWWHDSPDTVVVRLVSHAGARLLLHLHYGGVSMNGRGYFIEGGVERPLPSPVLAARADCVVEFRAT